jgi:CubicO group peptidase (beta-lactamase class C family)
MKKILLTTFLITAFFCCTVAQNNNQTLDKSLQTIYKKSNFPGFAIAIIKPDTVLFSKGYGYADRKIKTPYTTATIQPVGSVSKTFIALALMKAVELGYFTLATNINDLLPFKIINPNFPNGVITIQHLATHTSSLIDNDSIYVNTYELGKKSTIQLGDFLKSYYTKEGKLYSALNFDNKAIGSNYAYSNIAAALTAYIIEVKASMPFDVFTRKYIFEPLQMTGSDWFYNDNNAKQYAILYEINTPEVPQLTKLINTDNSLKTYCCITYPDGSLKTSVNDLTKYLQAIMKGYAGTGNLITDTSYKKMFAKQFTATDMPTNMDKNEANRAIFWSYTKKDQLRHTGSDAGVFAFISFDPKTKIGRVMTMNAALDGGDNAKAVKSFYAILEELNKYEEAVNNSK